MKHFQSNETQMHDELQNFIFCMEASRGAREALRSVAVNTIRSRCMRSRKFCEKLNLLGQVKLSRFENCHFSKSKYADLIIQWHFISQ